MIDGSERAATILLVEDNPDDEELTLMALRGAGILNQVVVTRSGAEALDYLLATGAHAGRDAAGDPKLVLLDLKLPKLGGLEVLRRLRAEARTRLLPVVVLSSSRQEEDVVACYKLGANSFVCKPVEFDRFAEAVGRLGLYWLLLNEGPPTARTGAGR